MILSYASCNDAACGGDVPLFRIFKEKYDVLKTVELVVTGYSALLKKEPLLNYVLWNINVLCTVLYRE